MGAAIPVVGAVVGGVSAVSQLNAQKKQAQAQRNAIDQQRVASEQSTAARLIEIERQKLYQQYNTNIARVQRESQRIADDISMNQAGLADSMLHQQQLAQTQIGRLGALTQNQAMLGEAAQTEASALQEAANIRGSAFSDSTDKLTQLANQLSALSQQEEQYRSNRANAMAAMGAQHHGGSGLWGSGMSTGAGLSYSDNQNLAASLLQQSDMVQSAVGSSNLLQQEGIQQILYSKEFGDIITKMGLNEASFLRGTAARNNDYINASAKYNEDELNFQQQQRIMGLQQARNARDNQPLMRVQPPLTSNSTTLVYLLRLTRPKCWTGRAGSVSCPTFSNR